MAPIAIAKNRKNQPKKSKNIARPTPMNTDIMYVDVFAVVASSMFAGAVVACPKNVISIAGSFLSRGADMTPPYTR
jgi:hypothetical protein